MIGFSMGAQQAFQWAVSYPEFADRIVATSGTAKTYPHGIVRLEGQIAALTADAAFQGGDYTAPPSQRTGGVRHGLGGVALFAGVVAARIVARRSRRPAPRSSRSPTASARASAPMPTTTSCRRAPGSGTTSARRPVSTATSERALRSIKVPLLYMPSETDLYFPIGDARYEAPFIPKVTLMPIPSLWGHTAGAASNPADAKFLNENIARFLAGGH